MGRRKKLLLLHLVGQYPMAGIVWQAVHHLIGLERLGYEVYYVEDSGAPPYDPRARSIVEDATYGVETIRRMMKRFDLGDRWAYWDPAHDACYGMTRPKLFELYREADGLVNICGATRIREEHLSCPVRVYLETDPVFEQIKLAQGDETTKAFLDAHTHHFTYGENLGGPGCPIPLERYDWKTTRPPVVLDLWGPRATPPGRFYSTLGSMYNVGKDITFRGERYYWSKHVGFTRFLDLPQLSSRPFELAMEVPRPEMRALIRQKGWSLVDPLTKSRDPDLYQDYIYGCRGEFSVSKDLVVRTQSGWFSDRSVCYLAAARPVIVQETGFSRFVPTGRGLFAFNSVEEALQAVEQIESDYAGHCRAAREIAGECYDAGKLLSKITREAGL
ncbi:MAG: hypothetical protein AB1640_16080 [bacterium]